jgi:CRP-like cAMP-binding protein
VAEPPPDSPDFARWLRHTLRPEDFETLPQDDVEALRRFAVVETHPPGTTLFRQGDMPEAIFVIEAGAVELVYETRFERLIVMIVRGGSSIGDLPVMLETPYPYSAVTRASTTTLRFSLETMQTLIELYPHICFRWLRLLSRRMARAQRRLVELAGRSAFEQVVHFLLHEVEERNSPIVELTQKELAEALALSRQTVSRVLGPLERQGLITRGHGQIEIRDLDRLRHHLPH